MALQLIQIQSPQMEFEKKYLSAKSIIRWTEIRQTEIRLNTADFFEKLHFFVSDSYRSGIYLLIINSGNTRTMHGICSNLTSVLSISVW